ncbi:mitochondrial import inner membrane translocase subunit Tim23-like [Teleopsis dalmanni]|nr:mitochondrial import inner membrane translocase subunit Tim23-like [Teleopsis dalmanni]XP_037953658.1 mitochondrial import inner membrane translocase subunit Tim23-like [Teleopsis dalmanni]
MAKEFVDKILGQHSIFTSDNDTNIDTPTLDQIPMTVVSPFPKPGSDVGLVRDAGAEFIVFKSVQQEQKLKKNIINVGTLFLAGGTMGSVVGLFKGFQEIRGRNYTGKIKRTILLNYILKEGAGISNTLAVFGIIYTGASLLVDKLRPEKDDDFNMVLAATSTGLFYKSTAGLKKCLIGGLIGMCGSGLYSMYKYFKKSEFNYFAET